MKNKKWFKKWYILPAILLTMVFVLIVGGTVANFVDTETSNGNTMTGWTSSIWTQTSQSDFNAGVLNNVDTTTSPGNVILLPATLSNNPTANTNGTVPWTNPANGYTSDNSYATVSPAYNATPSNNPTSNTNGTVPWTNPANGYTSDNNYATVSPAYNATPSNNPTSNTNGTIPWTNPANGYTSDNSYATVSPAYNATTSKNPTVSTNGTLPWTNGSNGDNAPDGVYATVSPTYNATTSKNPTVSTNGTLPWTNGSNGDNAPDGVYATVTPTYGATTSKQPTANTNGIVPWTNPANAYDGGTNQYASVTPAYGATTSKNPTGYTDGTLPWTSGINGETLNSSYATVSPTYGATTSKNPTGYTDGTYPWTNGVNGETLNSTYATATTTSAPQNNPSSFLAGGTFTNPGNAYTQNSVYASTGTSASYTETYTTYGFNIPSTAVITAVSVNWYGYMDTGPTGATVNLQISGNGGTSFYGTHAVTLTTTNAAHVINVTSDASWTPAMFNNNQCYVKVNKTAGNKAAYLDWLPVTVTYTFSTYDEKYGTFAITDPGTGDTITKVEVGYDAYATATGSLNIYTSADNGSTFGSAHPTGNLPTSNPGAYTYIDVTSDLSPSSWTWTTLGTFGLKVVTNLVSGTPTWYLDAVVVRVTYSDLRTHDEKYGTFAITDPGTGDTITKVEVGYDAYATATGSLNIYTSADNGSTFGSAHATGNLPTSNPGAYTYIDVTSDLSPSSWTWTTLGTFGLKVVTNWVNGTPAWYLDAVVVRVTYSDLRTYDQKYGTFAITDPGTGDTITKVEVGYEAYATATGSLNIYTSADNGSTFGSAHPTGSLGSSMPTSYTYIDVTSDQSPWTWTTLGTFGLKVVTNLVSGTPAWYLDNLIVRVTYSDLRPYDQQYGTFAITDPGTGDTITKVEVGYKAYATATGSLNIYTSADNGSTWSNAHPTGSLATSDPGLLYIDVTSDQTWTWSLLGNCKLKVVTNLVSGTPAWYLDAMVVRVTYSDLRPYDQQYGTFAITDPGTGDTITKVEVGYKAYATATGSLNIYTSADNGSTWSNAHPTGSLATSDPGLLYIDVTSDQTWTWSLLGNCKLKVVTNLVSGTPAWYLDAMVVRVTYSDLRPYDQQYGTFGVTGAGTITKVEVGYEAFATATGSLNIYTSANGGSTWSGAHATANLPTTDPNAYTYIDVTSDQTWTWSLLGNFGLKVVTNWVSGTPAWSLDALAVRVTYSDFRPYDQIYGTFGITGVGTITKVEVGYEAFATATGSLNIYTSDDVGSTWSSAHATANLPTTDPNAYTYIDVTSDQTWTWSLLGNFGLKVVTNWVSGTPAWSLDALVVRVTYSDLRPYDQQYGTFGFATSGTITKVEVGYEAFATATGSLNIYTSADGGSTWSGAHATANLPTTDPNAYTYIDVTSDQTWTWSLLNDSNFKLKVVTNWVSGTPAWSLDALVVRVTRIPPPGTIASQVFDTAVSGSGWDGLVWDATLTSGTGISVEVRASDTSFLKTDTGPSWVSLGSVTSPVISGLPDGRYKQWRFTLTTSIAANTPTLQDAMIYYYGG